MHACDAIFFAGSGPELWSDLEVDRRVNRFNRTNVHDYCSPTAQNQGLSGPGWSAAITKTVVMAMNRTVSR